MTRSTSSGRGHCITSGAHIWCRKSRSPRGPYSGRRSHGQATRKIVALLDGGNAKMLPLVRMECGHTTRSMGIRFARCAECAEENRSKGGQDARV